MVEQVDGRQDLRTLHARALFGALVEQVLAIELAQSVQGERWCTTMVERTTGQRQYKTYSRTTSVRVWSHLVHLKSAWQVQTSQAISDAILSAKCACVAANLRVQ